MILKECMLVRNSCYREAQKAKMTGIVVHDTGAGNPNLKRYVQPVTEQNNYFDIIADLGTNTAGNHWNRPSSESGRWACVHAFIGKNAKGNVETYQTLPYDICCWGVGDGKRGSYNYPPNARIQFEICDDGYKSKQYFDKVMLEAQEYCAMLCRAYGWGADKICCHYEAYQQGYGGNHSDITVWLKTFGKNMDWFRNEVQKLIDKGDDDMTEQELRKIIAEEIAKSAPKKYHYFSELPNYAQKPIRAMWDNGYLSGRSAGDLDLTEDMMRINVQIAGILKDKGTISY